MERNGNDSREAILDAAETVVRERGANHLTIDAVAQVSGFSKGGVLYNFPTKKALLEGMVDRTINQQEAAIQREREVSDWPRPTLRATLRFQKDMLDKQASLQAVFAATAEDPKFAERIKPFVERSYRSIVEEANDVESDLILWLAYVGRLFLKTLDLSVIPKEMEERIDERSARILEKR